MRPAQRQLPAPRTDPGHRSPLRRCLISSAKQQHRHRLRGVAEHRAGGQRRPPPTIHRRRDQHHWAKFDRGEAAVGAEVAALPSVNRLRIAARIQAQGPDRAVGLQCQFGLDTGSHRILGVDCQPALGVHAQSQHHRRPVARQRQAHARQRIGVGRGQRAVADRTQSRQRALHGAGRHRPGAEREVWQELAIDQPRQVSAQPDVARIEQYRPERRRDLSRRRGASQHRRRDGRHGSGNHESP